MTGAVKFRTLHPHVRTIGEDMLFSCCTHQGLKEQHGGGRKGGELKRHLALCLDYHLTLVLASNTCIKAHESCWIRPKVDLVDVTV